jgi:hypothetical protein
VGLRAGKVYGTGLRASGEAAGARAAFSTRESPPAGLLLLFSKHLWRLFVWRPLVARQREDQHSSTLHLSLFKKRHNETVKKKRTSCCVAIILRNNKIITIETQKFKFKQRRKFGALLDEFS